MLYLKNWYEFSERTKRSKGIGVRGLRKRITICVIVFLAFFLAASPACAYIPCQCDNPPDQCTCFIQLGDKGPAVKGIIEKLQEIGYLGRSVKKKEFTPEVKQAVIQFQKDNNLKCTGWMDDDTLNVLLRSVLPDKSVKYAKWHWNVIFFVPTDGGIRYHGDPSCCDMHNPRMISAANAESLGIHFCGLESISDRSDLLTYSTLGLTPRELPDSYYEEDAIDTNVVTRQVLVASTEVGLTFIGNKNSKVFHQSTCGSVARMSEKNKVLFSSPGEAIAAGYHACENCNP